VCDKAHVSAKLNKVVNAVRKNLDDTRQVENLKTSRDAQAELPGALGATEPMGGRRVFQVAWEGDPQPVVSDQEC
jgi:hypothetical protein